jgi:hypothetical protein
MSSTNDSPHSGPSDDRVLFAAYPCYLDNSSGAAVASRALLEGLARRGFAVEAVSGSRMDLSTNPSSAAGEWPSWIGRGSQARPQ